MRRADDPSFSRQRLLPEVQASGQERLVASTFALTRELEAEVRDAATRYAEGAGLTVLDAADAAPPFVHADAFRHAQSRAIARGAHLALNRIKDLLSL